VGEVGLPTRGEGEGVGEVGLPRGDAVDGDGTGTLGLGLGMGDAMGLEMGDAVTGLGEGVRGDHSLDLQHPRQGQRRTQMRRSPDLGVRPCTTLVPAVPSAHGCMGPAAGLHATGCCVQTKVVACSCRPAAAKADPSLTA
jgi:hypothetical protein